MFAETIIHNANVETSNVPWLVQAIAIVDGRIQATGTKDDILALRGPSTRMIDAGGRAVNPGLTDPTATSFAEALCERWSSET